MKYNFTEMKTEVLTYLERIEAVPFVEKIIAPDVLRERGESVLAAVDEGVSLSLLIECYIEWRKELSCALTELRDEWDEHIDPPTVDAALWGIAERHTQALEDGDQKAMDIAWEDFKNASAELERKYASHT